MAFSIDDTLWQLISRNHRALETGVRAIAKSLSLTLGEAKVLAFLSAKGQRTVPQMARALGVTRQNVQVAVNALLERGFLVSLENPDHLKSRLFALSVKGETAARGLQDQRNTLLGQAFSALDLGEKTLFKTLLQKIL